MKEKVKMYMDPDVVAWPWISLDDPKRQAKVELERAMWDLRYAPMVAIDTLHFWVGENGYLCDIIPPGKDVFE